VSCKSNYIQPVYRKEKISEKEMNTKRTLKDFNNDEKRYNKKIKKRDQVKR